jgi:hypothetical protein
MGGSARAGCPRHSGRDARVTGGDGDVFCNSAGRDLKQGQKAWPLTQARKPQTRKAGLRYPASKMTGEGVLR